MRLLQVNRGLGDHIALAGLSIHLARQQGTLMIPCLTRYFESLSTLYDGHPEIVVMPGDAASTFEGLVVASKGRYDPSMIREAIPLLNVSRCFQYNGCSIHDPLRIVGFVPGPPAGADRDHYAYLYHKFGLDYSVRWQCSPIPNRYTREYQLSTDLDHYAFVHDDASRSFAIDERYVGCPIIRPDTNQFTSVLRYSRLIENADEIHVIDSSFFHLVEQLQPKGKLFFHRYVRRVYPAVWGDYETRHNWTVLECEADGKTRVA